MQQFVELVQQAVLQVEVLQLQFVQQLQVADDVPQSLLKQLAEPLQHVRCQTHGLAAVLLRHGLGWAVCRAGQFRGQQVSVPAGTLQWSQRHQARAAR